jgi:hypothetical protein
VDDPRARRNRVSRGVDAVSVRHRFPVNAVTATDSRAMTIAYGKPPLRMRLTVLGHQLRNHIVTFAVGADEHPALYRCKRCRKSWEAPWVNGQHR